MLNPINAILASDKTKFTSKLTCSDSLDVDVKLMVRPCGKVDKLVDVWFVMADPIPDFVLLPPELVAVDPDVVEGREGKLCAVLSGPFPLIKLSILA